MVRLRAVIRGSLPALLLFAGINVLPNPVFGRDSLLVLYNNLGVIYAGNGQLDLAVQYLDSALQIDSSNAAALNNLGNCYLCQSRIKEALNLYAFSYSIDSLDKGVLFNWSVGLYVADSVEQSIELMRRFLDFAIANPQARSFSASFSPQLDSIKGDASKLGKAEIDRLLSKARERMKRAVELQRADTSVADSIKSRQPAEDSLVVVPAGAKSVALSYLAKVLYWIIL